MDIIGRMKISLNYILSTLKWSSKNSKERQPKTILCDICWNFSKTGKSHRVWGGIHICEKCKNIILSMYVYSNVFKTLCVNCNTNNDINEKCSHCSIPDSPEEILNSQ